MRPISRVWRAAAFAMTMGVALYGLAMIAAMAQDAAPEKAAAPGKAAAPAKAKKAKKKAEPKLTPGGKWVEGSMDRPRPRVVTPGTESSQDKPGLPPSDAIVLFDGKDLSHWTGIKRRANELTGEAPKWKVENGDMEVTPKTGDIVTKDKFGDCQIHIEWASPKEVKGSGQGPGNSGVYLLGHCEIQVLDSYDNDTYPDGQAAAIYHRYPPLVNACRKPGEWQTYDIILMQPRFDNDSKTTEPARVTVHQNGILVQYCADVPGDMTENPILLQDHGNPVRYRNIWVRKIGQADQAAAETKAE